MRKWVLGMVAGLSAASFACAAQAVDEGGNFAVRGIGGQQCDAFIASLKADQQASSVAASWLTGYLTALNRTQKDTFDLIPVTEMVPLLKIVVGLCANNQKATVEGVAFDIFSRLSAARVTSSSPIVDVKVGTSTVQVREAVLRAMQGKLAETGLFKGAVDGKFGPTTEAALKSYQTAEKLPVTGAPDAPTIIRLLVEQPAQGARK